jgi:hypothetical protein
MLVSLDLEKQKKKINQEYEAIVKIWQEQFEMNYRLARADFEVKCVIAKANRDRAIRELEGK